MEPATVPLTIIIPTRDEAGQITDCLEHLRWADEVIVADAGSTDETVELGRRAGARVLEHTGPTIAAQRNAAIAAARNEWVFALDADERITTELREELGVVLRSPVHPAYQVRRQNLYLGREVTRGRWGRDWVTRLFTRDRRYIERRVHESLGPIHDPGRLHGCLRHTPYRDLAHHLEKITRYSQWGAMDLFDRGRHASAWDLSLRPLGRFLQAYLLEGHCWDGRLGLISSGVGAYGVFVKYAHLWHLQQRALK
jgi:glycosyltransferase involved in cell wall biosynthesis